MKSLIVLITANFLLAFTSCRASAWTSDAKNVTIDTQDINCIAETEKYSWVGTNHGLYFIRKRDGQTFRMQQSNSSLPSDTITSIATLSNGEAYIGTTRGLLRYDNFAFLVINKDNSALLCNNITSLATTHNNDVYVGTRSGGITVFNGSRSKTFTSKNAPFSHNHVVSIKHSDADALLVTLHDNSRLIITNRHFSTWPTNNQ